MRTRKRKKVIAGLLVEGDRTAEEQFALAEKKGLKPCACGRLALFPEEESESVNGVSPCPRWCEKRARKEEKD